MVLGALLPRIAIAAVIAAALALTWLTACSRHGEATNFRSETERLRAQTAPADATVDVIEPEGISSTGAGHAVWEVDGKMDWIAYRAWLIERLGEYTFVGSRDDLTRLAFVRPLPSQNEMWTVNVVPLAASATRARIEFKVVPE
jgi:hypothetical protein